jgi:hypothetical protein
MRGLKQDRSARVIAAGTRSSKTFAVATMSWRSTNLRLGGWRSRWPDLLWRSDLQGKRSLQHAAGRENATAPLGQGGRIDLVVLEPGRGDGFAAARKNQMRLQLQFLEQLDQPAPAVGGLEGLCCICWNRAPAARLVS